MTVSKLYFRSPGWKFYGQGVTLSAGGLGLTAFCVFALVVDPWNWVGVMAMAGSIFGIVAGVGLLLLTWFIFIYGTIRAWHNWRQLRPPVVTIDATGVYYHASRPAMVPWADIEQVCLHRTIFPKTVISKIYLRLTPDAALIRDGKVSVPGNRNFNVGLVSELDVPEEAAVRFLTETTGAPLEIEETDNRPSAEDTGRY